MNTARQKLTILGATGSVGVNTLRVVESNPERFEVFALTANNNHALLLQQCLVFEPRYAVLCDEAPALLLQPQLREKGCATEVLCGAEALADVAIDYVRARRGGPAREQGSLVSWSPCGSGHWESANRVSRRCVSPRLTI